MAIFSLLFFIFYTEKAKDTPEKQKKKGIFIFHGSCGIESFFVKIGGIFVNFSENMICNCIFLCYNNKIR